MTQTIKERKAKQRNYEIFRLRGMYESAGNIQLLDNESTAKIRSVIDFALLKTGAQMETTRRRR